MSRNLVRGGGRIMYGKLKQERLKRQHRRASQRYRKRHPSHRMKYGHNFRRMPGKETHCNVCGEKR